MNTLTTFGATNKDSGCQLLFCIGESDFPNDDGSEKTEMYYFKAVAFDDKETYFYFENKSEAVDYIERIRNMLDC